MIDEITVVKIANLARIQVSPQEITKFCQQLSSALAHFEQISAIDTTAVEPLITPSEIAQSWRADEVKHETSAEQILANAPERRGNLFTVPPVV